MFITTDPGINNKIFAFIGRFNLIHIRYSGTKIPIIHYRCQGGNSRLKKNIFCIIVMKE